MATADLPKTLPYQPVRLSVERYHKLTEAGAFTEHDQVELLDGVVTEKMAKNPPHRTATRLCDLAFSKLVPEGWHVQNQEPVTLKNSEPEPDVAIVRGRLEDYSSHHPGPNDLSLVVEVADTSLVTDRYKAELYADAGIPVYWIVNLAERVIQVFENPASQANPPRYESVQTYAGDDTIPIVVAGKIVAKLLVNQLLP